MTNAEFEWNSRDCLGCIGTGFTCAKGWSKMPCPTCGGRKVCALPPCEVCDGK